MKVTKTENEKLGERRNEGGKRAYSTPRLEEYGRVADLTKSGGATTHDGEQNSKVGA